MCPVTLGHTCERGLRLAVLLCLYLSSIQPNMVDAAVTAIQARLNERDSNIRGSWLVTE